MPFQKSCSIAKKLLVKKQSLINTLFYKDKIKACKHTEAENYFEKQHM